MELTDYEREREERIRRNREELLKLNISGPVGPKVVKRPERKLNNEKRKRKAVVEVSVL